MIDYLEVPEDGEKWEAFARDFLVELGFSIESPPDRGADQGKDLLVVERLTGTLNRYPFRWLVSCKHFAKSSRSVSESDEKNVLERLAAFDANGFIGFYSTVPSAGLNNRLLKLRQQGHVRDYQIFDGHLIENYCLRIGYSRLLVRYFPQSYRLIAPLHVVEDEYLPLNCQSCGKDLLPELFAHEYPSVVSFVQSVTEDGKHHIRDIYWACKGRCDTALQRRAHQLHDCSTSWEDIADLVIPAWFLRYLLVRTNRIRDEYDVYTDEAYQKEMYFLRAIAQKAMREMTERERERVRTLARLPNF